MRFNCLNPAISLFQFSSEVTMYLGLGIVHNHLIWYANVLKHVGQGVVSLTFLFHGVGAHPMEVSAIDLSIPILSGRQNVCFHSVSEDSVRNPVVTEHPVIGFKPSREGRIGYKAHSPLGCYSEGVHGLLK